MKLVEIHTAIAENTACLQESATSETRRRQLIEQRREHLAGMIELAQTVHRFHRLDALVLMVEALKDQRARLALEASEGC
jgi:hypothetical protein